jgi:hypothetical protein
MSLLDFQVLEYRPAGKPATADAALREQMYKMPIKELVRRSKVDRNTVRRILRGQPVRLSTLSIIKRAVEGSGTPV